MTRQKKAPRRINARLYGLLTGILFIGVGLLWFFVTRILVKMKGFGLGRIVNILPIIGLLVVAFGCLVAGMALVSKPKSLPQSQKNNPPQPLTKEMMEQVMNQSVFNKPNIKGLVLDLDGTLLNTIGDLTLSANLMLAKHGLKAKSEAQVLAAVGNGIYKLVQRLLPAESNQDFVDQAYEDFLTIYAQHYMDNTHPYPGIGDLVAELNKRGYLMAVVSNKRQEFTERLIHHHFGDIPFVAICGDHSQMPKKPDPKVIQYVADKMLVDPSNLVMVGDSEVDIQTAHNAHMIGVGVSWGFRSREILASCHPRAIIDNPAELLDLLTQLNHSGSKKREDDDLEVI